MAKKIDYASMYIHRSDGRYQGYWHELAPDGTYTGKRHTICDRDPERLHRRIQEKEAPQITTLQQIADRWETDYRQTVTDRTWKNMAKHKAEIVEQYGDRPVAKVTALEINQDLLAAKARGLSHTVVNTRRVIWNGIMNYAVAHGDAPYNPALSVKLPRGLQQGRRSAPSDDMIDAILSEAWDMEFGFIPFFLLCTGCRRNEALQRRKEDIDLERWELHIPKSKTKAGVRTVPIIEPLRKPLETWMWCHRGQWLFPYRRYNGRSGSYMTDTNWETQWAKYCARHGWVDTDGKPTLGAHHLRHGTATLLYEAGVDMYTAQAILGHAQVTTTMAIYTELREKHKEANVEKYAEAIATKIAKTAGKAK